MNKFADKVKTVRDGLGLTMEEMGNIVGLSKGSISLLEDGRLKLEGKQFGPMMRLCVLTDTDPCSLVDLSKLKKELLPEKKVESDSREIVVLDCIQATNYRTYVGAEITGDGMTVKNVQGELADLLSNDAFAMVVGDDSMAPKFKIGDEIYIDPRAECNPGDIVVAKVEASNESTMKKYRLKGMDSGGHAIIELVPTNEDYPTILINSENPGSVIGPVVRHSSDPRRK